MKSLLVWLLFLCAWPAFSAEYTLTYYTRFNGPSLSGPLKQNYNVFVGGPWPIHQLHSLDFEAQLPNMWSLGAEGSALHDLAEGVRSKFGTLVDPTFTIFHPSVYVKRYSMWTNAWFFMTAKLSFYIPTSEFARRQTQIVSIGLNNDWAVAGLPYEWTAGIITNFQPTIYKRKNRDPNDFMDLERRYFFASIGHYVTYKFHPDFDIASNSTFDINRYSGSSGVFNFETASEDRTQLAVHHFIERVGWINEMILGAYVQSPIYEPAIRKTIVGVDFSLEF